MVYCLDGIATTISGVRKPLELLVKNVLIFVGLHIGFLKTILDNPDYLVKIIGHVEDILRLEEEKPRPGHESLVFNLVEKLYAEDRKAAILVEMPLGLKLLNMLVDHSRDSSSYYDLALRNLELALSL